MRKFKKLVAIVLSCMMVFAMSTTAFAAEGETENEFTASLDTNASDFGVSGVMPRATKTVTVGSGYTNVTGNDLRSPHGNGWFYYAVVGSGYNGFTHQINCLMYNVDGNVVWRGDNICGVGTSGKLEYGGNVRPLVSTRRG